MPPPHEHHEGHTAPTRAGPATPDHGPHLPPGTKVASYTITTLIGIGGMGAVYAATQDKPNRTVALKLIRPGNLSKRLLKRFEFEAEVLGRLQHPGIAQIYEAGVADTPHGTQPFFAMELIRGATLPVYAIANNLSIRERLALVADLCDAVAHAHQKGVIHRDLKPSNVLVTTDAQVKILDFGVARVTDADINATTLQTDVGQIIGTIQYMSPEQAAGDPAELDTRTDVYALGVILFELLSGRLPHDITNLPLHEAAAVIVHKDHEHLSSINKSLRGDIQTIVDTALAKEKLRRYPTASALAQDIRRYLDSEPIAARPASALYQLRKFARRNKPIVAGAAAVLLALVTGLVVASIGLSQAVAARDAERDARALAQAQATRASNEAETARQIALVLSDMLEGVQPEVAQGRDTTILREILEATEKRIETDFAAKPHIEAPIRNTLGITYLEIGEHDRAHHNLTRALALYESTATGPSRDTAVARNDLALLLREQGKRNLAEPLFRQALEELEAAGIDPDDKDRLTVEYNLCLLLQDDSRDAEAAPLLKDVHERMAKTLGPHHPDTIKALTTFGTCLTHTGDYDTSVDTLRHAADLAHQHLGRDHPNTLLSLNALARLLHDLGRFDEALPIFEELLESSRRVRGPRHPHTATQINNLAGLLTTIERFEESAVLLEEAVSILTDAHGTDHPDTATSISNLAGAELELGREEDAERHYAQALDIRQRTLEPNHPSTLNSLNNLAFLYKDTGRPQLAEPLYRQALDGYIQAAGDQHPNTLIVMSNLAEVLRETGRPDEALPLQKRALDNLAAALPEGHWLIALARMRVGATLTALARYADAEPLLLESRAAFVASLGETSDRTAKATHHLVELYIAWSKPDDAATWRARLPQ